MSIKDSIHISDKENNFNNHLIIGKRVSGKTILIQNIINSIYHKTPFDYGIIFSHTKDEYSKYINNGFYYFKDFNPDIIENIIKTKKQNTILIFDDCSFNKKIINDSMKNIIINNRSLKIHNIISINSLLPINSEIRGSCDFIYIPKDNNISTNKRHYEYFFSSIPFFKTFNQQISSLQKYKFLTINQKTNEIYITNTTYELTPIKFNIIKNEEDFLIISHTDKKQLLNKIKKNNDTIKLLLEDNENLFNEINTLLN
jgi:hypothetical protein